MERKKVLLMYSGGLDSILSMARLVSQGYKVLLVHFDNGCSISTGLEVERTMKFENGYGKELKLKLNIPQYPYKGNGRLEFD